MEDYEFPKAFSTYKKKYEKHRKQKYRGNIYGIILENVQTKEYLLVKGRETGKYSFPKGHIEPNEKPIECMLRELYEETGIELFAALPQIKMKELIKSKIGIYLCCETQEGLETQIKDSNEIEEAGWYSLEKIKSMKLNADVGYYFKGMGLI
jgi:8-oxo-dGTP pyrophosphatase MutT (NUDIX family)